MLLTPAVIKVFSKPYRIMKKDTPRKSQPTEINHTGRRNFIKLMGIGAASLPLTGFAHINIKAASGVALITDSTDKVATSAPAQWAIRELIASLNEQGIAVRRYTSIDKSEAGSLCIVATGAGSSLGTPLLKAAGAHVPATAEALALVPGKSATRQVIIAAGHDERGLVYALLELADRVNNGDSSLSALRVSKPVIEQPANKVRGLNRLFVSDVEDKPWYNDREMWPKYLTMLASQRFNRFNLSMGIGYDFLQQVTDAYFLFAYPFLVSVPGYDVRVAELPGAERDNNLAMLKFISEQTVARGMEFRLGIWMHGYEWLRTTNANYNIKGLTKETQGPYCRDALRMLLQACPAISGITFRVHGESGVNEGSYDFWKTVFDGIKTCGRVVEIDMHSKGIDQPMLDTALSVGVPVTVSPKFWAEHMGMPYHQADIRSLEIPKPNKQTSGLMALSDGARSFMRYGYGDLLKEDRKFDVLTRIWPGTQRLLLWGDPVTGAAQSRIFSFCGSAGVELMEPLSFKGRRGSGIAGDRCGYADASLKPQWDWEKYLYSLRVFGRTLYNPDTEPDVWNRYLRKQFGPGAPDTQLALASATRILPTVLTAHAASAGNNNYWPEMYTNMPICNAKIKHPYSDSPAPRVFGNVSPLDPQLFLSINEFIAELLKSDHSGKYTPIEVAQWIEDHADTANKHLAQAAIKSTNKDKPEYRRMSIDVAMQVGLGKFFGAKLRAGALYSIYEQTQDRIALEESLKVYRAAREHWNTLANSVKDVYKKDVTAGELTYLRGHWLDRLPAMDEDIEAVAKLLTDAKPATGARPANVASAVNKCLEKPQRLALTGHHKNPKKFKAGTDVEIAIAFNKAPKTAKLYYRHVNQGERYETADMKAIGNTFKATIPSAYSNSPYPLEYYFELKQNPSTATLYPGFGSELKDQPYFVMRKA